MPLPDDSGSVAGVDDPGQGPLAPVTDANGLLIYPTMFLYVHREQARKILGNSKQTMCFRYLVKKFHLDGIMLTWDFLFTR